MARAQLSAGEALVPSAVTSVLVVAGVALRSAQAATAPAVTLVFFALLPSLLALALVQEQHLLAPCKRVFMAIFRCGDPLATDDAAPSAAARAVAAARADLHRTLADCWPVRRVLSSSSSSSAVLAVQPPQSRGARMRRRRAAASSSNSSAAELGGGKSLYDQVKANLEDHAFRKAADAPLYFMDATTGLFLRVNAQHKLVFTNAPDASCLFHVTRGKTHHWGFLSAIYHRYIGQNFVGRVVVNAKKLQGWESFRVLQRPDGVDGGENTAAAAGGGDSECSKTVYMILCSSRFGKGMWLAKNRRSSASLSASLGPSRTASNSSSSSTVTIHHGDEHARDNIYLSKNFANALALTYATDLSAFEYLANDSYLSGGGGRGVVAAPKAASPLPMAMGTTFQAPVLAVAERTHVALPWIADPSSKRFFELSDKQLTEVLSTTITRCTTREFVDMLFSEEARKLASEKIAAVGSGAGSAGNKPLSEWHLHPTFGFVRKLSYRPEAMAESEEGASSGLKAISIDQYHSFVMNEKAMDKVTFRSKLYTLSTPYSNCFSIETVFELEDLVDTSTGGPSPVNVPVMQFRCHTGVHFTRSTMFASLVEKGALQGVKNTCDLLLETAKERRGRAAVPPAPVSSGTATPNTSATTASKSDGGVSTIPTPSLIPPHTLAMEVIKGMIIAYHGAKSLHSRVTSLPVRLPWRVHGDQRAIRQDLSSAARMADAASSAAAAPTKIPFFESAPHHFKLVLEEGLGGKITPPLFFDSLLSDECSFLHVVHRQSGNMEVDVCAWRPYDAGFAGDSGNSSSDASSAYVRLQTFRMPLDGIPAVEIADVRDFQYYAFVHDERTGKKRLEFGSKLFVRDLPEGEHYSIEALVHVEMNDGAPSSILRVFYALPDTRVRGGEPPSTIFATVEIGVHQGLRAIWKQVALMMLEASQPTSHLSFFQSYQELGSEQIKQRLQSEGKLPSHDELASRLIAAIAAAF